MSKFFAYFGEWIINNIFKSNKDNNARVKLLKVTVALSFIVFVIIYIFRADNPYNQTSSFMLLTIAVIYSAVTLGWQFGILSTLVSILLLDYFILPPTLSFLVKDDINLIHLALFAFEGLVSTYIINLMQIALNSETKLTKEVGKVEAYYRKIMENSRDAIMVVDTKDYILDANPAACAMFKMQYKDLVKMRIVDLLDAYENKESLVESSRSSEAINLMFVKNMLTAEGHPLIVEGTLAPLYPDINVAILRDITSRLRGEERVYRTSAYLRAIIDSTSDLIEIKDVNGRYILINKAAQENLSPLTKAEIIGKSVMDLYPEQYARPIMESDTKVMYSGQSDIVEHYINVGSEIRCYLVSKNPLYNSRRKLEGIISIGRDITERKRIEERKDEFLSVASHELKTPLTTVKGYIQMTERFINKMDKVQAENYIKKAAIYADRLNHLVGELLDATKMNAGKLNFYLKEFSFDELIADAINSAKYMSNNHKIIFEGKTHTKIYGDKYRLEQVMNNILSNAIKYSPDADTILVKVYKDDNFVTASVTDYGMGIPANKAAHIFEKFYRTEESEKISGLGIGLYISYEIVKRHGGKLWFESKEGEGTTFYFSVPLSKEKVLAQERTINEEDYDNYNR